MENKEQFFEWCEQQHARVNHLYDGYIPYKLHLRLSHKIALKFEHLWKDKSIPFDLVECGVFSHDILENTNISYNDFVAQIQFYLLQNFDQGGEKDAYIIANISYALWDEKGKSRSERHNAKYFKGVRETPGATFGKLCDRIANV